MEAFLFPLKAKWAAKADQKLANGNELRGPDNLSYNARTIQFQSL
jgi:hypothetical protein